MSVESEVAGTAVNSLLKVSIEGAEFILKISGKLAKHSAAMLLAALNKPKTKGQIRLKQMIKEGKPISIFSITKDDIYKFSSEARKYGVTYHVVRGKEVCDIMVTADQSPQVKKVLENLKIGMVQEVESVQAIDAKELNLQLEKEQSFADDVVGVSQDRAEQSHLDAINQIVDDEPKKENPNSALTKDPPSKPLSKQNDMGSSKTEKTSIKKEIEKMKYNKKTARQSQPVKNMTQNQLPKTKVSKK